MDKTDRISFSCSFDLAGQNKILKDPGQVYKNYQNRSMFGRSWVDVGSILGVFWGFVSVACFCSEKATYINFQKIDFF